MAQSTQERNKTLVLQVFDLLFNKRDYAAAEDGILVEHWDVIQDEATIDQSKSGLPMFGNIFPKRP